MLVAYTALVTAMLREQTRLDYTPDRAVIAARMPAHSLTLWDSSGRFVSLHRSLCIETTRINGTAAAARRMALVHHCNVSINLATSHQQSCTLPAVALIRDVQIRHFRQITPGGSAAEWLACWTQAQ